MSKIIWIWGWEFRDWETLQIDMEIIRFSQKTHPNFLFIPTASNDSREYTKDILEYFEKLWCETDVLYLLHWLASTDYEKKILESDIIYVWWWNTLEMMKVRRRLWIDKILQKALNKNIVLCGLSAWWICWFKYWNSDSRHFKRKPTQLTKVKWLWFINALFCPHYTSEENRELDLKRMMKGNNLVAIAIDDNCAIQIQNESYKIITSQKGSKAYTVYRKKWEFFKEEIKISDKFSPIKSLIQKNHI